MHAPDRSRRVDAAFRRWLARSPLNEQAFELANEVWDGAGQLLHRRAVERRVGWPMAASLAALAVMLSVLGITLWGSQRESALHTSLGEQRTLTLPDGTRVSLNTESRIVVEYDAWQRLVRLEAGEALFEVAPRPDRPFRVLAADREVRALGTSFLVRLESQQVAVTLVEGKVSVAREEAPLAGPQLLTPGERVTYSGTAAPKRDRPSLERLMSWRQGRVMMDHTPLADAVAEMNRYSATQLVVVDSVARTLQVSGVFRVGDPLLFAQAIAATYGLHVSQHADRIELEGVPAAR